MLITQLESMEGDGVLGKPLSTELSLSLHNASATVPCLPYKEKASNHAMSSFPAIAPSMSLLSPTQFSTVDERCSRPTSYPLELLPQLTPNRVSVSSSTSWEQPTIPLVFSHLFPAGAMDMNQPPVSVDRKVATPESTSSPTVQRVGRTSGIGSLFNMIKRERERSSSDAEEQERTCEVSSRGSDEDGEGGASGPRKKLRLSKEQSMLLEQSFKEHSTLNPKQKAELAKQLKLRPRQVEVWFQNRRARTKLKQTEVDCELLKRCCESLTEENRRLQKEVKELRAFKAAPPWVNVGHDLSYMPLPAATLTMCPSCERIATHGPDNSLTTLGFAGAILKAGPSSSAARAPTNLHLEVHQHHSFPELPPPRQPLSSAAC